MTSFISTYTLTELYQILKHKLHRYDITWTLSISEDVESEDVTLLSSTCSTQNTSKTFLLEEGLLIEAPVILRGNRTSPCLVEGKRVLLPNCSDVRVAIGSNLTEKLPANSYLISETTAFVCMHSHLQLESQTVEVYLTLVCQSLSIFSLLLTLFVYCALPNLRTLPGKCVMCLCSALLMAQVLLQWSSSANSSRPICIALAAIDHWAWLEYFCWMVILAFDIHSAMRSGFVADDQLNDTTFGLYLAIGWGAPMVFVAGCLTISLLWPDLLSYTDGSTCWVSPDSSGMVPLLLAFALPLTIALIFNAVFFIRTMISIRAAKKFVERVLDASQSRNQLGIYVRLVSLTGFTWVLGLVQNVLPYSPIRYAFIICNALQGVCIMVAFVCKRRIARLLIARIFGPVKPTHSVPSTSYAKNHSSRQ